MAEHTKENFEWESSEHLPITKETLQNQTRSNISESFDLDKEKIIKQLKAAKNVEQRVKLFAKIMDRFWLEAIAWMIPRIWDVTPAAISTCYLIAEWIHIWLSLKECLQILWYQALDALAGSIPVIWNVVDFFFKGNKYSSKVFSNHIEKLKKAAKEKWISQEEIDNIWKDEAKIINTMDRYTQHISKNKKDKKQ